MLKKMGDVDPDMPIHNYTFNRACIYCIYWQQPRNWKPIRGRQLRVLGPAVLGEGKNTGRCVHLHALAHASKLFCTNMVDAFDTCPRFEATKHWRDDNLDQLAEELDTL